VRRHPARPVDGRALGTSWPRLVSLTTVIVFLGESHARALRRQRARSEPSTHEHRQTERDTHAHTQHLNTSTPRFGIRPVHCPTATQRMPSTTMASSGQRSNSHLRKLVADCERLTQAGHRAWQGLGKWLSHAEQQNRHNCNSANTCCASTLPCIAPLAFVATVCCSAA
jgi:hypothetical protein